MNTQDSSSSIVMKVLLIAVPVLTAAYFFFQGMIFNTLESESSTWPHTIGTITSVSIQEEDPRRTTWFDAWVSYQYEIGTETFTGRDGPFMLDRYTSENINQQEAIRRANELFPQGKKIEVAYNPYKHDQSTLQAGQSHRSKGKYFIAFSILAVAGYLWWELSRPVRHKDASK